MRPLLSYYGSKWRLARAGHYPPPIHGRIIEPFAGGAGYSQKYADLEVTLIDAYEPLVQAWQYLIGASRAELLTLPLLAQGETVDEHTWPCEGARYMVGYWLNPGCAYPCKQLSSFADYGKSSVWCEETRASVAELAERVRHWEVIHGDYSDAPDVEATWFVDPPYQGRAGTHYKHGSEKLDYTKLGEWCQGLLGQVIVCESDAATWLPFEPLVTQSGTRGYSKEVIYLQGEQGGQQRLFGAEEVAR